MSYEFVPYGKNVQQIASVNVKSFMHLYRVSRICRDTLLLFLPGAKSYIILIQGAPNISIHSHSC